MCIFIVPFTGGNTLLQMQTIINTIPIHNLQGAGQSFCKLCLLSLPKDCKA